MEIGELSQRTGVSARSLRYYEEQGLLKPSRNTRGHRVFHEGAVDRVRRIQQLYRAGINSETMRKILPCTHDDGSPSASADEQLAVELMAERARRIAELDDMKRSLRVLDGVIETALPNVKSNDP